MFLLLLFLISSSVLYAMENALTVRLKTTDNFLLSLSLAAAQESDYIANALIINDQNRIKTAVPIGYNRDTTEKTISLLETSATNKTPLQFCSLLHTYSMKQLEEIEPCINFLSLKKDYVQDLLGTVISEKLLPLRYQLQKKIPFKPRAITINNLDPNEITAINFTADGNAIIAGDSSGYLYFVDLTTDPVTITKSEENNDVSIRAIAYDIISKSVISASEKGAQYWDPYLNKSLGEFFAKKLVYLNVNRVTILAAHNKYLATAGKNNTIHIWQQEEENKHNYITSFAGHTEPVTALTFNRDASLLASGAQDLTVRVWSIAQNTLMHLFDMKKIDLHYFCTTKNCTEPSTASTSLAFGADESRLVSSNEHTFNIWDVKTGQNILYGPTEGALMNTYALANSNLNNYEKLKKLKPNGIATVLSALNNPSTHYFKLVKDFFLDSTWLPEDFDPTTSTLECWQMYPPETITALDQISYPYITSTTAALLKKINNGYPAPIVLNDTEKELINELPQELQILLINTFKVRF